MEEEGGVIKKGSRTLEEEIYWTNFKSMRFFQFLTGDFHSQLVRTLLLSLSLKALIFMIEFFMHDHDFMMLGLWCNLDFSVFFLLFGWVFVSQIVLNKEWDLGEMGCKMK